MQFAWLHQQPQWLKTNPLNRKWFRSCSSIALAVITQTTIKGDFALQTKPELLGSGYVEPGDADGSHFLTVLRPVDGKPPAMPKDSPPLTKSEIETLEKWITEGAQWPDGFDIPEPAITSTDWWSWNPIVRQEIPKLENPYAARFPLENAVDAFILNKLIEKGLQPSAPANRRVLIRRVYYDLLGLPPTPEQIETFVESSDPMAYERLIDDLLASPAYGERWARHWLDIVKYADTAGYDKDKLRPNAWPYRDYVIKSFNQDKPYARFVREQLAGDQLFPGTEDGILGLGFVAAGPWDFIGHVEVPETKIDGRIARYIDRDEMVTNAMNTFVSTTVSVLDVTTTNLMRLPSSTTTICSRCLQLWIKPNDPMVWTQKSQRGDRSWSRR